MKGYGAVSTFTPEEQEVWRVACVLVEALPEQKCRCHELVRVIGEILGLPWVDGQYGVGNHSWLEIGHHNGQAVHILDVYAVGRIPMVQLVPITGLVPEAQLYRAGAERTDIDPVVMAHLRDFYQRMLSGPGRLGILSPPAEPLGTGWGERLRGL